MAIHGLAWLLEADFGLAGRVGAGPLWLISRSLFVLTAVAELAQKASLNPLVPNRSQFSVGAHVEPFEAIGGLFVVKIWIFLKLCQKN